VQQQCVVVMAHTHDGFHCPQSGAATWVSFPHGAEHPHAATTNVALQLKGCEKPSITLPRMKTVQVVC
jgi:hypothetical protein